MEKEIYKIINNETNIQAIGNLIANTFIKTACQDNIDYDFEITQGTGKLKSRNPNTSFHFDTKEGNPLHNMKKALFGEDLKDITKEEDQQLMNDTNDFLTKIYKYITDKYFTEIQNTIRKVVLSGSKKEDIPLNTIQMCSIDIVDYSSVPEPAKYLIRIGKMPGQEIPREEIIQYVHEKEERTGENIQDIFQKEKNTNPIFEKIESLEKGKKYLYDITVTFFVDYSLAKMPPNPAQLKI